MKLTDILKHLKEILILLLIFVVLYFLYQQYKTSKVLEQVKLNNLRFEIKIDSLNQEIQIGQKKIIILQEDIMEKTDSINEIKDTILIIEKQYDSKYKDIRNYRNIDIYNEFKHIFTTNNIK